MQSRGADARYNPRPWEGGCRAGRDTLPVTVAVPPPDPVELADGLVEVLFEADPLRASLLGFHDRDAELPDLGDAAERALAGRPRELAAATGRVDRDRLDPGDRLTVDVGRQRSTRRVARAGVSVRWWGR